MNKGFQTKKLLGLMVASVLLTACGGGGSDSGSTPTTPPTVVPPITPPVVVPPITPPVVVPPVKPPVVVPPSSNGSQAAIANIGNKNHEAAALAVTNFISLERKACGLGGLSYDPKLAAMSTKHANYIQHVLTNTNIGNLNPHEENGFVGYEKDTGQGNPHFSGVTFNDRLMAANPATPTYYASENIVQRTLGSTDGIVDSPETAALSMARGLMSAPYHLRMLINPDRVKSGASLFTFSPNGKDATKNIGYVLVDSAATASNSPPVVPSGIITYPCASTKGTVTALYNESPDPTKGTGRNLRTDPIGQPVHILVPSAQQIKVSNIKITDVARKIDVPVTAIDYNNDPYAGTSYELPKNEVFIMPLTDGFKSCEAGKGYGKNQCGLYGNSEYAVSFDVLIDNKTMQTKSFTFKTGDVNY